MKKASKMMLNFWPAYKNFFIAKTAMKKNEAEHASEVEEIQTIRDEASKNFDKWHNALAEISEKPSRRFYAGDWEYRVNAFFPEEAFTETGRKVPVPENIDPKAKEFFNYCQNVVEKEKSARADYERANETLNQQKMLFVEPKIENFSDAKWFVSESEKAGFVKKVPQPYEMYGTITIFDEEAAVAACGGVK